MAFPATRGHADGIEVSRLMAQPTALVPARASIRAQHETVRSVLGLTIQEVHDGRRPRQERRPCSAPYSDGARPGVRPDSLYDAYTAPMKRLGGRQARRRLFGTSSGEVLELGVGTGTNLENYPAGVDVHAVDISPRMLARARRRAELLGLEVEFTLADVEDLPYPDDSFDTGTAACVFCSVANLCERSRRLAGLCAGVGACCSTSTFDRRTASPVGSPTESVHTHAAGSAREMNRRTEQNITAAGLRITHVRRDSVWREIVASPAK